MRTCYIGCERGVGGSVAFKCIEICTTLGSDYTAFKKASSAEDTFISKIHALKGKCIKNLLAPSPPGSLILMVMYFEFPVSLCGVSDSAESKIILP